MDTFRSYLKNVFWLIPPKADENQNPIFEMASNKAAIS